MKRITQRSEVGAERRSAFTLIEMMVVIIIIAIMAGLLLTALGGANTAASVAQAQTEISQLETAIAAFEQKYGVKPPSRFVIPPSKDQTGQSKAIARRIWSQIQGDGGLDSNATPVTLIGPECLVFFLAGDFDRSGGTFAPLGFNKNPRTPFATGGSREGPFYEFPAGRLQDLNSNGFPEFVDPLDNSQPYLYLTPAGYKAQNNNDPNNAVIHSGSTIPVAYLQSANNFWKPKDYQIISAGLDGAFGNGGLTTNLSGADEDNITNFSSGSLGSE